MIDLTPIVGMHLPPTMAARLWPDILWRVPTESKIVNITIDDGPTPLGTGRLLDVLAQYEARATFFLLGEHAEMNPGLVRALTEEGHTIGNHTYSHRNARTIPEALLFEELHRATYVLEDLIQSPIRWMRPPFGYWTPAMRSWCRRHRQRLTMWDVRTRDYLPSATRKGVERRALKGIRPGSVVLMHDHPNSTDLVAPALAAVLERLRDDGWQFAAL